METGVKRILSIIPLGLALVLGTALLCNAAHSASTKDCYADEQMPYTQVQGSGLFSLFMLPGMLAIGGMGAAATPEWSCTTKIAVMDAAGATLKVRKFRDRGQVEPQ